MGRELPSELCLALAPKRDESQSAPSASDLGKTRNWDLATRRFLLSLLKPVRPPILMRLWNFQSEVSSSEIFAALLELELAGKVELLPGRIV